MKSAEPSTSDLGERVADGLGRIMAVMRQDAWSAAARRGLTPTQARILAALAGRSAEGSRPSEIAHRLSIGLPTMSEAVAALVRKRLVRQGPDPVDGRARLLTLTRAGRARAHSDPSRAIVRAVEQLAVSDQDALLRSVVLVIRQLQESGAIVPARVCVTCAHFRPDAHPGSDRPHHCAYVDAPLADRDLRVDCREHESAPRAQQMRVWQVLIKGRPAASDRRSRP